MICTSSTRTTIGALAALLLAAPVATAAPPSILDRYAVSNVEPMDLSGDARLDAVNPIDTSGPLVDLGIFQDDAAAAPAGKETTWDFKFVFGFGGSWGNTDRQSLNTVFQANREVGEGEGDARKLFERSTFTAEYFWGESSGVEDQNRFIFRALQDWYFVDTPWLVWARLRFDNDEFQSWDQRLQVQGGGGYKIIEEPGLLWDARLGIGGSREWGSMNTDFTWELTIATTADWQINDNQRLSGGIAYFPALENFSEFRTESNVTWSVALNADSSLTLNTGLEHEYMSQTDPGRDKNDTRLTIGIGYTW